MYTVLYVDDEPALLELGKTFLELSGSFTVDTALSAKEGIEALKKTAFDCIVADYQMPEMDGLAFLKFLRKENNWIPFILFTGRGREEVVIEAVNSGVDYYLQKGGDPKSQFVELEHKIKLAIERRRTDDELKESRQRMTDIIDHLPDATLAIDLDGKVIAWNLAMEEMTGVHTEQILGRGDHSYAIPFYGTRRPILLDLILRDDEETWKKYPQIIRKDTKLISEIHIPILYGGKGAYLWFIASPLYDTHGNITGAIESIRDITDRKMAENELRAAYEQNAAAEEELRDQYDELKKSGDALQESEENYRTLFDEAADLIAIVDAHGTFLNLNRKFVEESGYPREEMIGKNVLTSGMVTAPSAAKIAFHLGQIFLGSKSPLFEIDGVTKNGTIIPYEIRATPIITNGKISAVQATLRNLTERKNAEKEISDRKKMLEEIVSGSPIPQFVIDKNHRVVSWNRALEESSGVNAKEVLGTTHAWKAFYDKERPLLADLLIENELKKIQEWYAGKSDKSKYVDGAYEATDFFPRMGGGGIWLYFTAAVLRDSEGNIVGAVETLENITERKKAEEELRASYEQITASEEELRDQLEQLQKGEGALRESEKNYRSILENIQDAYYRSDSAGNLILASPSIAQLLGYDSVSDLIGKNIAQSFYYHPEERSKLLAELTSRGSITDYEVTLKKRDGKPVPVSTSSHRYYDHSGNFLGVEGIFRDVTERKRSEEERTFKNVILSTQQETSPDAILIVDENGNILNYNQKFIGIWGIPELLIVSRTDEPVLQYVVAQLADPEAFLNRVRHLYDHKEEKSFEELLLKDGRILERYSAPMRGEKGKYYGRVWYFRDITGRKRSEEMLRESESHLSSIIRVAPIGIGVASNRTIQTVNDRFCQMTGYTEEELIGKQARFLYPTQEDHDFVGREKYAQIAQKGTGSVETRWQKKDGTVIDILLSSTPVDPSDLSRGVTFTALDITERKKIEDSLRANEEKYRSLVDNLNVGVYRNTPQFPGRWLWANPAFVRIFGYDSLPECMEHPVTDIYVNPDDRKKLIQVLETEGFVRDFELQQKKKDGTPIWVSVTAQAKKNPDGTIEWIDGICDDITALKDAEERGRRYQLEMSRAIDYLPDATFIIDRKGTVLAWNRAIEDMTGVCAKDIIGRGDYEYAIPFYGHHRPILIDLIFASEDELKKGDYLEIKRTGEILSVETQNPILKGKPSVVRAIAAPIYDEGGNVAGAIETITDITELKRAQEDLRESENRYRTIFENTGAATVLLEENTIISIANVEFERMSGYLREELEGKKSWTEFVVKEDLERMLAQHRLRREKHEVALRHYEFRFVTKTGEIRNIFLTIDVIPGTKQSVASLMDITAQVRAQDAVKLANKKLNLLSGITRHDIRNQLLALSGYLELSKESPADPARTSEFINKEAVIADTITRLINFTKDYEDMGINAPAWQNVHAVIGKAITLLPMRDIRVDAGDPALEVFADPLLERVFYNLIDNALRYGGDRMTAIWVSSHMSGNGLVIVFEDDGAGIAIQDKVHLFEKGFGKNTGLGLFLTREILEITGITITVNGEPGNGVRFEITVPKGAYRFAGTQ
ncbi:MAG: PAS domain S-box protein [Methanoregula sp.]|nr:PAS domain S-box protein [Methanoregula sp.]